MEKSRETIWTFRRLTRPLLGLLAVGLLAGTVAVKPAAADEWGRGRGDAWRRSEWRDHAWRAERAREWREAQWRERMREAREAQWRARHAYGYGYPTYYNQGYSSYGW